MVLENWTGVQPDTLTKHISPLHHFTMTEREVVKCEAQMVKSGEEFLGTFHHARIFYFCRSTLLSSLYIPPLVKW